MAPGEELLFELLMVLNYAIVNNGHPVLAVCMRVSVGHAYMPMCGSSGMGYADVSLKLL